MGIFTPRALEERPQYGVDLFRLDGCERTFMGTYPSESAAKRSARLDFHSHGSRGYALVDRAGRLVCEGYTVSAGRVADFVVTYGWGGSNPDPDPPPAVAQAVPATHNRIAFALSRLGRREAA